MAKQSFRSFILLTVLFCSALASGAQANTRIVEAIGIQRDGLENLLKYMDSREDLFARDKSSNPLLNLDEKREALKVWVVFLDYMSALQSITSETRNYRALSGYERDQRQEQYAYALTAQYRFGLEFIRRVNNDAELVKWYNLEHEDYSLPQNLYLRFRDQTLSDWTTDNFDRFIFSFAPNQENQITQAISRDRVAIGELNRVGLLATNSANTIGRSLYRTYFPIQKNVARGIGKVKLWRIGETLITPEQAFEFSRRFEPGDFYLTRKEWRLSNAGIPGYWTHSVLYIGSVEERAQYFDTPEVNSWLSENGAESFEDLLKQVSPAYAAHPKQDTQGEIRVLEALDAGVIFNSIETSLDADGAAVFRPRLSKLEKAKAIYNAFHYVGLPYDFQFDFDTDSAMVCSELIVKAYQPAKTQTGIEFPMYTFAGRKMLTPSEIAKWYDDTLDTPKQTLDLVMFIDSHEAERVAFEASKESFTGTWRRSNWHTFRQPALTDDTIAANRYQ